MLDADYLRRQAEKCLALSRATFDLSVARRLRGLADEFRDKAAEVDRHQQQGPRSAGGSYR
jgi:hypothetical protein